VSKELLLQNGQNGKQRDRAPFGWPLGPTDEARPFNF